MFTSVKRLALCLAAGAFLIAPMILAASTTYSKIESSSGWGSCISKSCSGGGGYGTYWMKQGVASPALDGGSAQYYIGPTSAFANALWWKRITTNTGVSHFKMDMYQYIKAPSASNGIEYAANQVINGRWYKFSTQCSFNKGIWSVWDTANSRWVATSVPCRRPGAYTWQHLTFEYARSNGKAVFVAITINGQKYYVNKSFYTLGTSAKSGDIGVHYQLNGNSSMSSYSSWVDKWSLTIW